MEIIFYIFLGLCILGVIFVIGYTYKERKIGTKFVNIFLGSDSYRQRKIRIFPFDLVGLLNTKSNSEEKYSFNAVWTEYLSNIHKNTQDSLIKFPSKHLLNTGHDENWFRVVEKQNIYANEQEKIWKDKIKERYNLSPLEMDELDAKLFNKLMVYTKEMRENFSL